MTETSLQTAICENCEITWLPGHKSVVMALLPRIYNDHCLSWRKKTLMRVKEWRHIRRKVPEYAFTFKRFPVNFRYIYPSIKSNENLIRAAASCGDSSLQLNSTLGRNQQQQRPQQTVIQWAEPVLGGGCCWVVRGDHDTELAEYTVHCWLLHQTQPVLIKTHSLSERSDPAFALIPWPKCDPETKNWEAHKQTSEKMSASSESNLVRRWDRVRGVRRNQTR